MEDGRPQEKAQVIIEFTFCMIIIFLMLYGIMMVLRWTGIDLAERGKAHEAQLLTDAPGMTPADQIDPFFYRPVKMNAVWLGD